MGGSFSAGSSRDESSDLRLWSVCRSRVVEGVPDLFAERLLLHTQASIPNLNRLCGW